MKNFFGRRVAIDASMSIYQFLIALKFAGGELDGLTNEEGEVTSHLQGMFNRTIRMVTNGMRPVYVFDGAAPELKSITLAGRKAKAEEAAKQLENATEEGDKEEMLKLSKRTVRASKEQIADCRKLLELMGIPVVQAAGEAEATCAAMVNAGQCWATATEDMDALTFGTPILVRHLNLSAAKKQPILEVHLAKALEELKMTMPQFVDLCILMGCDYAHRIRGIGPEKAYEGIRKWGSLEAFLKKLDKTKYPLPDPYPYEEVRELFNSPAVGKPDDKELQVTDPKEDELIQFLVEEKKFARDRVEAGIKKLKDARGKKTQSRLDGFFTSKPSECTPVKRKAEAPKHSAKKPKPGAKGAKKAVVGTKGKKK
eukprot:TRINITY_DN13947_c0_g1_i1.p1 TRINITY_DN13947_c0_g1~~TRINITY_DN13947_c0_g1_i1.p1  ORF type:complete len:404 (+),score=69.69 TRINITY_DN13947_c0_g1_i1:108-1214(+)